MFAPAFLKIINFDNFFIFPTLKNYRNYKIWKDIFSGAAGEIDLTILYYYNNVRSTVYLPIFLSFTESSITFVNDIQEAVIIPSQSIFSSLPASNINFCILTCLSLSSINL